MIVQEEKAVNRFAIMRRPFMQTTRRISTLQVNLE
jgi:hypothetical protein